MAKFKLLVLYKQKHGHTKVPSKDKVLGSWVSTQRTQYKNWQKKENSNLTDERISKLKGIGFVWAVHTRHHRKMKKTM